MRDESRTDVACLMDVGQKIRAIQYSIGWSRCKDMKKYVDMDQLIDTAMEVVENLKELKAIFEETPS